MTLFCCMRELSAPQGRAMSNRWEVRAFRSSEAMYKFLSRQTDNSWKETYHQVPSGDYFQQYDAKTGDFRLINVKKLIC